MCGTTIRRTNLYTIATVLHMGFEPTTYRLKAGYSAIELMEYTNALFMHSLLFDFVCQ